jgi:hypothetical protein
MHLAQTVEFSPTDLASATINDGDLFLAGTARQTVRPENLPEIARDLSRAHDTGAGLAV